MEGYDTANKLLILANSLMDGSLRLVDVEREGITPLTTEEVQAARVEGRSIKLVGVAEWEGDRLRASVRPRGLEAGHPLAAVDGAEKGVTFHSDLLGALTVTGGASGRIPAAASILRDLINLVRQAKLAEVGRIVHTHADIPDGQKTTEAQRSQRFLFVFSVSLW